MAELPALEIEQRQIACVQVRSPTAPSMAREYPRKQVHVIRTVAERKPHSASRPPDLGGTRQKDWAGIEVFRFDAAEKIEHWDVLQVVPTDARNA